MGARLGATWIVLVIFRVRPVPIPHPLPDVAVQVVQAPSIGFLLADRMRRTFLPELVVPGIVAQLLLVVTKAVSGTTPRPAGVFPLCFRQQPIILTGLLGQPLAVGMGIRPRHIDDRMAAPAPALVTWLFPARGFAKSIVFLEGDGILANTEMAEGDGVGGLSRCFPGSCRPPS